MVKIQQDLMPFMEDDLTESPSEDHVEKTLRKRLPSMLQSLVSKVSGKTAVLNVLKHQGIKYKATGSDTLHLRIGKEAFMVRNLECPEVIKLK